MAAHSSILTCKIPWTEKPGRIKSVGSQRGRHDWAHQWVTLKLLWPGGSCYHLHWAEMPSRQAEEWESLMTKKKVSGVLWLAAVARGKVAAGGQLEGRPEENILGFSGSSCVGSRDKSRGNVDMHQVLTVLGWLLREWWWGFRACLLQMCRSKLYCQLWSGCCLFVYYLSISKVF